MGICKRVSSGMLVPGEPFLSFPIRVACGPGVERRIVIPLSAFFGTVYREPVAIELYSAFIRASSETSSDSASEGGAVVIECHACPPDAL